jgi:hypothetical protein
MDLKEIGQEGENWIHLAQKSDEWQDLGRTIMNLRVPQTWEFLSSFSGRTLLRPVRRMVG